MAEDLEARLRRVANSRAGDGDGRRYQEASRARLLRILQKKVKTSFIGALAKVEEFLGRELWGHGLDESECTPGQLAWREVWEQARTEILNNGNNQLRAVESEVVQYTVSWDRYQALIPAKKDSEEGKGG